MYLKKTTVVCSLPGSLISSSVFFTAVLQQTTYMYILSDTQNNEPPVLRFYILVLYVKHSRFANSM